MVGKVSSVRLAMGGFAAGMKKVFAEKMALPNLAMITDNQVLVHHVVDYMPNVLALQIINMRARGPAMPVAQAPPAVANILNARVQAVMSGKTGVVRKRF